MARLEHDKRYSLDIETARSAVIGDSTSALLSDALKKMDRLIGRSVCVCSVCRSLWLYSCAFAWLNAKVCTCVVQLALASCNWTRAQLQVFVHVRQYSVCVFASWEVDVLDRPCGFVFEHTTLHALPSV